jgi:hypothetical protein
MLAQLGIALGDLALRGLILLGLAWLGGFECLHGLRERAPAEHAEQPCVEFGNSWSSRT